ILKMKPKTEGRIKSTGNPHGVQIRELKEVLHTETQDHKCSAVHQESKALRTVRLLQENPTNTTEVEFKFIKTNAAFQSKRCFFYYQAKAEAPSMAASFSGNAEGINSTLFL